MSSKILSPGQAVHASPMDWRQIGAGAAPGSAPRAGGGHDQSAHGDDEFLRFRLAQAQAEAKRQADSEYHRGLAEGEAAGLANAAARYDAGLQRITRTIADLASLRDRFRREAEQDLVRVSLAIARRVLRREIQADPEAILGLVKVAMEKISLREVHRIRLHPEDLPAVRAHLDRIQAPAAIQLEADPGLERGAVLFETIRGTLDVSIETQLRQIERGFAGLTGERT